MQVNRHLAARGDFQRILGRKVGRHIHQRRIGDHHHALADLHRAANPLVRVRKDGDAALRRGKRQPRQHLGQVTRLCRFFPWP